MGTKKNFYTCTTSLELCITATKLSSQKVPEGYVIVPISLPVLVSVSICGMKICSDQNEI